MENFYIENKEDIKLNLLDYIRTSTKNMIAINTSFLFTSQVIVIRLILHLVLAFGAL
ncbi:MAG TPA: hypothetical protein VJJ52_03460 [Candidatus Nanoarchaeia archaeon]|nr:hypothetical protein [Candidatus Nanoarchaeia archaeon]